MLLINFLLDEARHSPNWYLQGDTLTYKKKRGRSLPGGDTIGLTQIRGVGEAPGLHTFHLSNQDGSMAPAYMPCHIYSTASEPSCHFLASCIALCLNKRTLGGFSHDPEIGSENFTHYNYIFAPGEFLWYNGKIVRKINVEKRKNFPGRSLLWVCICQNLSCS